MLDREEGHLLKKVNRMALLQDFYGPLLTEKQREIMALYYDNNLSLSEIADECGSSRQAVHNILQRVEKTLETYESRLGFIQKFQQNEQIIQEVIGALQQLTEDNQAKMIPSIIQELQRIFIEEDLEIPQNR